MDRKSPGGSTCKDVGSVRCVEETGIDGHGRSGWSWLSSTITVSPWELLDNTSSVVRASYMATKQANEEIPHGRVEGVKGERRKRQLIRLYREYLSLVD